MPAKGEKVYLLEKRPAFLVSLLISFVVIFGLAYIVAYQSYTKAIDATIRSNETRATLLAKLILEHQRAAIGVLQSYADRPLLVDMVKRRDFEGALKHLIDLATSNPEMEWPFISNPDSTVWVNYPVDRQAMNKDLSQRDWYKGVSKEWKPYISSVYKMLVGEKDLAVAVSAPILDGDGKVIGILATAQSTAFFRKIIGEVGLNLDATMTLIDQEGQIIYSNGFPYTKEVISYPPLGFVGNALKGEKGDVEVRDAADQSRIKYVSFAPIEGIGWSIIVEKSRSEVLRSETSSFALIGLIAFLTYGFAVLFLVHLRQRHRQIQRLEKLNKELDDRVRERTAELEAGNNALRESEERYRLAIQASNDAIWDLNLTAGTVHWNETYAASFARPPETANSWEWWVDHIHPEDRDRAAGGLRAAVDGEANNWVCEYRFLRADGTWADIYDRACIARDTAGRAWRAVGAMQDLTEWKRAEQALRESEERSRRANELLEAVTKGTNVIIAALDLDLRYTFFNTAYAAEIKRLTGKDIQVGISMAQLFADQPGQLAVADREWREVLAGNTSNKRLEFGDPGRHRRIYSILHTPLRDTDGRIVGAGEVAYDVTEQVQAEEMLKRRTLELQHLNETLEQRVKERTAELSDLTSQIVSAQEDERRRVSYDLHDNVWQTLLAIRSEIERLFSDRNLTDREASQDKAKKVMGAILDMVGKIRSMQGDLWPYVLDDIGILATLDWYCREFEKKHSGLTIDSHTELGEEEILPPVKIVIYRTLQEALNNVAKHSRASHVTLRLLKKDHRMEFTVEDNGVGFDPEETIFKRASWGGLGLLSIKARTELSGGSFAVESAKGRGTTVRATWHV